MITVRDFLDREITLFGEPERVISLVPSITHTLIESGLKEKVVGRTFFCIKPEKDVKDIKTVGSPKKVDIDKILTLTPDLIIADRDENSKRDIETLIKNGFKVYVTFIKNVADVITFLNDLKKIFSSKEMEEAVKKIDMELKTCPTKKKIKTFVPIWRNPYMSFNENTYQNDILKLCGFSNVFEKSKRRYFKIGEDEIRKLNFNLILLPSEPFNFFEMDPIEIIEDLKLAPRVKLAYIPGEWIAWYGMITPTAIKELKKLHRDFFKKGGKI